ncbi:hypothetical protein GWE18_30055 [Bradyrhizobium sp. CSA112]|uniref:hypothetical protein n=1 Tax=Bradyrhizobium sp. CSA112 TaxID=2699170 RepID=UPI0023B0C141|nr:hypothetical protein [Bradyrhizobium sp. CSA112]MDE5456996.1 hypothetical protein [Bradyrhizobium sp. CSA112]
MLAFSYDIGAGSYPKGGKISDAQLAAISIRYDAFHPNSNYTYSRYAPHSEALISLQALG